MSKGFPHALKKATKEAGHNLVSSVSFVPAAGAANVSEVTLTFKNAKGVTIPVARNFLVWLSDAATGLGLTAVTASGAVAAKTANGTDLIVYTAKKAQLSQSLATGVYVLSITDSLKTGFYVCVQHPTGEISVSAQLITANYG